MKHFCFSKSRFILLSSQWHKHLNTGATAAEINICKWSFNEPETQAAGNKATTRPSHCCSGHCLRHRLGLRGAQTADVRLNHLSFVESGARDGPGGRGGSGDGGHASIREANGVQRRGAVLATGKPIKTGPETVVMRRWLQNHWKENDLGDKYEWSSERKTLRQTEHRSDGGEENTGRAKYAEKEILKCSIVVLIIYIKMDDKSLHEAKISHIQTPPSWKTGPMKAWKKSELQNRVRVRVRVIYPASSMLVDGTETMSKYSAQIDVSQR